MEGLNNPRHGLPPWLPTLALTVTTGLKGTTARAEIIVQASVGQSEVRAWSWTPRHASPSRTTLAFTLHRIQGRYSEAEVLFKASVGELRRERLGVGHPDVLIISHNPRKKSICLKGGDSPRAAGTVQSKCWQSRREESSEGWTPTHACHLAQPCTCLSILQGHYE